LIGIILTNRYTLNRLLGLDLPGLTVEADIRPLHADGVIGGPVVQDVGRLHYLHNVEEGLRARR
jgi:hypothetical protein